MSKNVSEMQQLDLVANRISLIHNRMSASIIMQQDAAKQLVTLTSFLQAIFFAAISFGDVKKINAVGNTWYYVFVALTLLTLICWVACLFFAVRVFTPREHQPENLPSDEQELEQKYRQAYREILDYKQYNLERAVWLLWISFLPMTINIFVYLLLLPRVPTS